jgi:FtsP/CotA-like multicopper oxidase with cupredoxin domain
MLTRRDLIKMGIVGSSGFVLLPRGGGLARVSRAFDDAPSSPTLTPFVDELPTTFGTLTQVSTLANPTPYTTAFSGAGTKSFELAAVERDVSFHSELPPTSVWAYVDKNVNPASLPNRLITVQFPKTLVGQGAGAGFLVRVHNQLPKAPRDFGFPTVTVHFHGGHQPAPADGFPHNVLNRPPDFPALVTIPVGGSFDYMYPFRDVGFIDNPQTADERISTYWYHDHLLDFTGANVYRGLANIAPAFDELDAGDETRAGTLQLPSGEHDIPLVLMDKTFDSNGALVFDPFNQDGFLGDRMIVNGVVQPFVHVKRRKYRFRFLSGTNARIFQLYLTDAQGHTFPMTQIATEGGLLAHPIPGITSFLLHMAQRVEVVIDFADPRFDSLDTVYVENRMAQTNGRKPDGLVARGTRILQFRLDPGKPDDPSLVPGTLRPFAPISAAELAAAEHHSFEFDRSHGVFTINGEPIDIENPIVRPRRNTPQMWTFRNSSGGWWHPIHVHSELMRVIRRNGRTPPPEERDGNARKDTVLLRDGETVDAFVTFRDFSGPFVFHCHNLGHEDMAMMGRFDVVDL